MGMLGMRCVLIVAVVGASTVAHAGGVISNGFGFVPGARVGAVRGAFDAESGWGYSTEVHVDAQRTFGRDKFALAVSVGILRHTHGSVDEGVASGPDAFELAGLGASLKLMTAVAPRTWVTARLGMVQGKTETAPGTIEATFTRLGLEVARMFKTQVLHVAGHAAVEYITGKDGDRGYGAVALVVGATFVFSNR